MFAHDLHLLLAFGSMAVMAAVAAEGAVRLVRAGPPGRVASVGSGAVAVLLGMTAAGGLALLLGASVPRSGCTWCMRCLPLGWSRWPTPSPPRPPLVGGPSPAWVVHWSRWW